MKNEIIKNLLKQLANAPAIVAKDYLQTLTNESDKADAERLLKALKITIE